MPGKLQTSCSWKKNLNVLYDGVIEGRKAFVNSLKYIFITTSANFGNMLSVAGASVFLTFVPLLPKQILHMEQKTNPMGAFYKEAPEVSKTFDGLVEALKNTKGLDVRSS